MVLIRDLLFNLNSTELFNIIIKKQKVDKTYFRTVLSPAAAFEFKTNMIPAIISSSFVINNIVFDSRK